MKNGKIHFIAIGGSAMHNLALALHEKGYVVSGSDDEINEPSRSRLQAKGILPEKEGWFPEKLDQSIEAVILGMHARVDNPELLKAQELGLKIFSYPEYLYEQSKHKKRVVIGGSHGKTTITSIIMHVLKFHDVDFDYMVGARIDGFDTMVRLSDSASFMILEGDEYLSSPIDRRPKFHLYKADVALLSGIAWDHINVFPTFEEYIKQFQIFVEAIPQSGVLVYCENDTEVKKVAELTVSKCKKIPYNLPSHFIADGVTYLKTEQEIPLQIFGQHNLLNLEGARYICNELGLSDLEFYEAIKSFKGASRRLELLAQNEDVKVFKDFAHSPSKLKATTEAVKEQYPSKKLIACMELHTFSSLNENFLEEYHGSMKMADLPVVYYNPHTIEHKKLKPISEQQVKSAFDDNRLQVFTESSAFQKFLQNADIKNAVILLMSSGNFDGINLDELAKEVTAIKI